MQCPFPVDSKVTWTEDAPATWRFIWTPGPMTVISARWDNGTPNEYEMLFKEAFGGQDRIPGWIILIEYDADSTSYYDPPLSLLLGRKRLQMEVHEMWLREKED